MAQRSRKRGRRSPPRAPATTAERTTRAPVKHAREASAPRPNQWFAAPTGEELTRSQRRDAEARASLTPLAPGEHPAAIAISTVVALALALSNLVAYLAGVKIGGKHPAGGGILLFSAVMLVCAAGLWRMWYGAVLGFMALLAIIAVIFALLLIEASNVLGVVVALAIIGCAGWLFFKLVRVLSRIQMPKNPKRR